MKIYDVTFPISAETPIYEGDPQVEIKIAGSIENGDAANVSHICCGVHTATHVDAPVHFINGKRKVHELELEKLVGDCKVIELDESVLAIEPEHLENLEDGGRVLFKTRNSAFWNEPEKGFRKDFTYITPEAARLLVDKNILLVGIDYLSIEKFDSVDFAAHIALLEKEIVILEGLDLREVPPGDYELICLPLKYIGGAGDGAPARTILRSR
ncbi:MAG: putative metal-dependent hydrolase [Acidobacteria bacterium]|jgi:arylformamidase|nr:putative metal-dependent hydrolase [Acidobacteriota bacterium]